MTNNKSLNGIARQLVSYDIVDEATAIEASAIAKSKDKEFISALIDTGNANATAIAQYVASDFGLSCFDISSLAMDSVPVDYIKLELLESQNAVPIAKRGSKLYIAISDPTNPEPLDKYKFSSGLSVEAIIVEEDKLAELRAKVLIRLIHCLMA